ncbi:MAG: hypothetical protein ACFFCS_19130 [Candidatus Hodarchaeota archaeon]
MDNKKLPKNLLILGILCVAAIAPLSGWLLDKWPVKLAGSHTIQEASETDINATYTFSFSIGYNEKATIMFSGVYDQVASYLIIVTAERYDAVKNSAGGDPSDFSAADRRDFIYSTGRPGGDASWPGYDEIRTISYSTVGDQNWLIEFAGSRSGTSPARLVSIPGDYVIVVFGHNDGTSDDVTFDLEVKVDSIGDDLEYWVTIGGWVLIGIAALLLISAVIKKGRGP